MQPTLKQIIERAATDERRSVTAFIKDVFVRNQQRELTVYKSEQFNRTFERDGRPERTKLRSW
jgi:hypothetical protein